MDEELIFMWKNDAKKKKSFQYSREKLFKKTTLFSLRKLNTV